MNAETPQATPDLPISICNECGHDTEGEAFIGRSCSVNGCPGIYREWIDPELATPGKWYDTKTSADQGIVDV